MRVNSLEFPEDETDKFYVGCEDYNIYEANLHSSNSREVPVWRQFASHEAPITKIALHPGKSMNESKANAGTMGDMSELMLSASMDWTIKLWYPKNQFKDTPLMTFESSQEYVYDVQWSPVHPSIFGSVDGDGYIDIWDINRDTEAPIARKKAFEQGSGAGYRDVQENRALSCLKWSLDGRKIAIGDQDGYVSIWNVDKELYMPQPADFDAMENLLKKNSMEE